MHKYVHGVLELWDRLICAHWCRLIERMSGTLHFEVKIKLRDKTRRTMVPRDRLDIVADGDWYICQHPHNPGCISVGRDSDEAEQGYLRAIEARDTTVAKLRQLSISY